ncbi:MAG: M3 family oligoendopeptidase [Phycisphaerales bacterium]|nr:M3 family oligoendopeptidase [Phycisphaerales bacterium]
MTSVSTTGFVPQVIDGTKWENIEPLLSALLAREVNSKGELEQWLLDRSDLEAAIGESGANTYIDMTCDTANDAKQAAYTSFITTVVPNTKPISFELDKKFAALAQEFGFTDGQYTVLFRDTKADVDLFRQENVAIETSLSQLDQEYDKICGAMTVQFDGEEKTMPMMGKYGESSDRSIREDAWRKVAARRLEDQPRLSEIYDEMVTKRHQVAKNADFNNFTEHSFKSKHRFDYTPETCFAFHDAIEKHVMPFVAGLDAQRKDELGLDKLRPWDIAVDPKGQAPLKPFDGGVDLIAKSQKAFDQLSPELAKMFATMGDGSNTNGTADGAMLDLDSRKGKAPGGYLYFRDRSKIPFIFMNAAGQHRDVETMVHEAGHAFHSMYCTDMPLIWDRNYPTEFAEVASMSMELLTMPYWDAFYPSEADANRARRKQLEGSISLLPWIATIDAFQHWVYENPEHTQEERAAAWLKLEERFGMQGHRVDWDGLENERKFVWQRQGHLFGVPFYYIEYGIAQLGALGIWLISLEQGEEAALKAYKKSLSLGGSVPLPELFKAAGLDFDFGDETVGRLVKRVQAELDKLPE